MSHNESTYTSSTFTSYSSSSNINGQTSGHRYAEQTNKDPSGTTFKSASQNPGEPVYTETRQYDPQGRPLVEGNTVGGGANRIEGGRVEDISEAEAARRYEERIEDEYAKREGGA